MLKKMTVLAMALGVVAALALPATAAATWKHHNTAIAQNVEIGLTGQIGFESTKGRIHCQITSTATFFAGQTTGEADSFNVHPTDATTNCTTGGGLAQCKVETIDPTNLPWQLHTTGTATAPTIQVTFGDIHGELRGGFCPYKHSTVTKGTATFQPTNAKSEVDEGKTVENVNLNGTTQGHLYTDTVTQAGETLTLQLTGNLTIEDPNKRNTYSI